MPINGSRSIREAHSDDISVLVPAECVSVIQHLFELHEREVQFETAP
eukprot:CAMPEP_0195533350 /NCGR_PEP_ID=MMETSP0794_2-20130614/40299_1 /TAXON_ID=515487 /ORGANISM="Stephanopyxis turris, Strain CCMP 815" /LENGTH=46 /DNA_ID= /DNA_START= /DNA_END= /DNA_ORIENTATION=